MKGGFHSLAELISTICKSSKDVYAIYILNTNDINLSNSAILEQTIRCCEFEMARFRIPHSPFSTPQMTSPFPFHAS